MPAPKKGSAGKRGRMRCLQHVMFRSVDQSFFSTREVAPQQKDYTGLFIAYFLYYRIGKSLPAALRMTVRFSGINRKRCVKQKHALFGPFFKVAMVGRVNAKVGFYFFKNIYQRRWLFNPVGHGEAKPLSLSRAMVGVLSQYNHLNIAEGGKVKCIKNELAWRINCFAFCLLRNNKLFY